ncbi:serine protease Hayan-like [Achroia grisella]|uniref:serine protease Hayan-like n=1 Tax=Achroia grisella TaxID=688607 RepID=UPI0027D22AC7|nr:serine protease Hayan-like [Achroia grisella]
MFKIFLFIFCAAVVSAQYEGEPCTKDGLPGTCLNIRQCQSAIDDFKNRIQPQRCGFSGFDIVVCCVERSSPKPEPITTTPRPEVATTTRRSSTTTEPYEPEINTYVDNETGQTVGISTGSCAPLPPSQTAEKTGQRAWDKCIEYQQTLVYPCEKSVVLTGTLSRGNYCNHNADGLIIDGEDALTNEFPHMALLGYGEPPNIQWLCGGTVLSDRFILTAGHCTVHRDWGNITYAVVGILRRDEVDNTRIVRIARVIKHPDYRPPARYNDIALLEVASPFRLGPSIIPACLYIGDRVDDDRASATGWGVTVNRGTADNNAEVLQKVIINKFTPDECRTKFPKNRLMKQGFDANTQICYGDKKSKKDTCQGDSGGPLQIKSLKINCMYVVIGVTSFGKACGQAGEPGIYTRVSKYVPWIEDIVWP